MSKAFTGEETPEAAPIGRGVPRLAPGEVRYVTPEGHAALRAEHARLVEASERAAGAGAVDAGGLRQRAALLEATLATLTVLSADAAPEGQVAFGSWVTVEDEAGARTTWRIVGPDEADAANGLVSANAPVARALLGRAAGDEVEVVRPGGPLALTVVEVRRSH